MSSRNNNNVRGGGINRSIICPCGFNLRGDPNRLDLRLKLHNKKCEICKTIKTRNFKQVKTDRKQARDNYVNAVNCKNGVTCQTLNDQNETTNIKMNCKRGQLANALTVSTHNHL